MCTAFYHVNSKETSKPEVDEGRERERETERQAETYTETERERERERRGDMSTYICV